MSIVAVSCQTGFHQAYGASEHFILFQSVGRGKDGRWWIATPIIFCIEKFNTLCGYSSAFCFFEKVVLLWSIGTKDG